MPKSGMPPGALPMLILRVLHSGSLHGYAIAQRIHVLSSEVLAVEEGLLYPTLQKMLVKGWVTSEWGTSETGRKVRFYRLTPEGRKLADKAFDLHVSELKTLLKGLPATDRKTLMKLLSGWLAGLERGQ